MVNKSIHNHPLEDLIKEKHRMGVTLIGVGNARLTLEISHEGVDLVALPECSFDVHPHDRPCWTPKLTPRECP